MSDFKKYLNVYEFDTNLPGSWEKVKFRPLTTAQLKRLLVYENEEDPAIIEDALDDLISSAVISENFDIKDLYLQDRFFLLIEIRRRTKGDRYEFAYNCPHCKVENTQAINLAQLDVKKRPKTLKNTVKLDDNISVKLRYMKRRDNAEAYEFLGASKLSPTQKSVEIATLSEAMCIESIITPEGEDKEVTLEERKFLLDNITADQYQKIKDWFTNNDFGVDFTFKTKCSCGKSTKLDIPVDNFFF